MTFADLDLTKTYSYADYCQWKFQDLLELIKGKIFEIGPAPSSLHQSISREISGELWLFLKGEKCSVFSAPFDVRIPRKSGSDKDIINVVQPDICVICDPNKIDVRGCLGAPDIVIEILSPTNSKRELKYKYDVYEEAGVLEYWLVLSGEHAVLIHRLVEGKFVPQGMLSDADVATSTVLPGFSLPLANVFKNITDL